MLISCTLSGQRATVYRRWRLQRRLPASQQLHIVAGHEPFTASRLIIAPSPHFSPCKNGRIPNLPISIAFLSAGRAVMKCCCNLLWELYDDELIRFGTIPGAVHWLREIISTNNWICLKIYCVGMICRDFKILSPLLKCYVIFGRLLIVMGRRYVYIPTRSLPKLEVKG